MLARRYLDRPILWEAALEVVPLSTSANAATLRAALTAMGLTLTRASGATCMTSASSVVTSGIGVDDPRVGDGGYGPGLVLEETRTNEIIYARDPQSASAYAGAGGGGDTATASGLARSDGTIGGNDRVAAPSGSYSRYYVSAARAIGTKWTLSQWSRSFSGTSSTQSRFYQSGGGPTHAVANNALSTTWRRSGVTLVATVNNATIFITEDARDLSGVPPSGIAAGARDAVHDLTQIEAGAFPTEAIITTGATATRAGERLQLSQRVLATMVRNGRLCMEFDFVPKAATRADYASAPIFFAHDAGNYAGFGNTIGAMQACVAGVAVNLSPSGIDWTAGQRVRAFIEIGNGTPKAWTKIDEAPAVYSTHATVHAAFPTISALDIMNYIGILQFSSWIRRIRAWAPGRRPAWAV